LTLWNTRRHSKALAKQAKDDERAFRLWIAPELGTIPLHLVTRDRLIAYSNSRD
jgi:hypothetical protein